MLAARNITSKDLRGKKTLVTFWSTTCGYCQQMLDDLREWDKTKGADDPNLLLFPKAKPKRIKHLDLNSPIVLDKEHKMSKNSE